MTQGDTELERNLENTIGKKNSKITGFNEAEDDCHCIQFLEDRSLQKIKKTSREFHRSELRENKYYKCD